MSLRTFFKQIVSKELTLLPGVKLKSTSYSWIDSRLSDVIWLLMSGVSRGRSQWKCHLKCSKGMTLMTAVQKMTESSTFKFTIQSRGKEHREPHSDPCDEGSRRISRSSIIGPEQVVVLSYQASNRENGKGQVISLQTSHPISPLITDSCFFRRNRDKLSKEGWS